MNTLRAPFRSMRYGQRGFSLIELMIVVVLVAILLTIGVPSFSNFIVGQRVKTAAFDLASTLLLARSEAIKRNADVTVAPKVAADGWVGGWTVTVGTTALSEQAAYGGITITNPSIPATVVYQGASGRPAAGKTAFTLSGGSSTRCVTVDLSGMTSTKTGACP